MQDFRSVYHNYIYFPALVLLAASFPLPIAYNSICTILLFAAFLGDIGNLKNNIRSYFSNRRNIFLLLIFLSLLLSLFYSDDKKMAMKGILVAIPLVSLPLAMTTAGNLSLKQISILKKVFVYSCLITSILYFIQTGIRIGLFDGSYRFKPVSTAYQSHYLVYNLTYHQLTPSIHAVFFSLYIAFAVLILLFGLEWRTRLSKILCGFMILYFLLYLILLTSATICFALYSFILTLLFFKYSFKKPWHYALFFGVIILGTAISGYLVVVKYIGPDIGDIVYKFDSPSINQKILLSYIGSILIGAAAILIKLTAPKNYRLILGFVLFLIAIVGSIYLRKEINKKSGADWKLNNISVRANFSFEAFQLIKKQPLLGVGIGDKKYKLIERDMELGDKRYLEFGESTKPDDNFNPHNQFLDFWIAAGIIPVIFLLLLFISEFARALRYRHFLYTGLLYCFCLFCFTDAAMMVQRGQIFFLFFICLFEIEIKRNPK